MFAKRLKQLLFILFVSVSLPSIAADTTTPPKDVSSAELKTMQEHMQVMNKQMQDIQSAKTPGERQALMQAHMKTMQEHMNSMCGCMNNMGMMHHDGNMHGGMMDSCGGMMHGNQ